MSKEENQPAPQAVSSLADPESVTQMLIRWQQGDQLAFGELVPLVYAQLREQARSYLRRERRDHTFQGTALVHEALLRLVKGSPVQWVDRFHFLRLASRLMRRILVDHARARLAARRNSGALVLSLDQMREIQTGPDTDLHELLEATLAHQDLAATTEVCAVDEALDKLRANDPRQAELVELRFFGGMTVEETAVALGVSPATVKREWTHARAWLHRELQGSR
jgi:RNA polymerase sigma factor (TIGR02999 family)